MKISWWSDFLKKVEEIGRMEDAVRALRISQGELRKLFEARPELMQEALAARDRYIQNLAGEVLFSMGKGHTFIQACARNKMTMEDGIKLLGVHHELHAAYEAEQAAQKDQGSWLGKDDYSGEDAILATSITNAFGTVMEVRFHQVNCPIASKKRVRDSSLLTKARVSPERAKDLLAESLKFEGAQVSYKCMRCGGVAPRSVSEKDVQTVHFTVNYGERSRRHAKTFDKEPAAISFARSVGATHYSRVEKVPVPVE